MNSLELPRSAVRQLMALSDRSYSGGSDDGSYESSTEVKEIILSLPLRQKQELTALLWVAMHPEDNFASALKRARRVSDEKGQAEYLSSKPLHRHLPGVLNSLHAQGISLADS